MRHVQRRQFPIAAGALREIGVTIPQVVLLRTDRAIE
jgi:hypothetical protein